MKFVADTHSLLWYFQGDSRLSPSSRKLFDDGERSRQVVVPTVVLAELLHISRKYVTIPSFENTLDLLEKDDRFEIHPLSVVVIRRSISLENLEMHDSLIVATALELDIPLMSCDAEIVNSGFVKTIQP